MPEILVKTGTQIRFFVAGSFAPAVVGTNYSRGTPIDVALTLSSVAVNNGQQSSKVDLGATRAPAYEVLGCVDFTGRSPTSGAVIDYYWAPSTSTTPGQGNVAGNSGVDAPAPGAPVPGGLTVEEFAAMCDKIGSLSVSDDGAVQNGYVGTFSPSGRYGQLIVVNHAGDAFAASDAEMHQVFNPIIPEVQ